MVTRYVDASMPDDRGDGLTPATAKRTPTAARALSADGDKILIKAGYCYAPVSGHFMYLRGKSNIEIGTYGTSSDKPILDGLTYENPGVVGWSYIGSGVWKKAFGGYYVRRLWVGSTSLGNLASQRVLGTAKRRATGSALGLYGPSADPSSDANVIAGLSTHDIWFGAGTTLGYALYVYTGSATINPPNYYGGIAFLQADGVAVGATEAIYVQAGSGIYAHDLHIRGTSTASIRLAGQNSDGQDVADCLFEDCMVTAACEGAFKSGIVGELTPAYRIKSVTVRRIYCDYLTSPDEQEPDDTYSYLSGLCDMFSIADGSVVVSVENCTIINSAHVGVVVGSSVMSSTPPAGCRVINNTIRFDSWQTYARGLSNFDGDALFTGNLIDGQSTSAQFAGSAKVIGNVWTNLRACIRKPATAQWIAVESYMYDTGTGGIGNLRYVRLNPLNVLIANNTAYGPAASALSFNFYSVALGDANNTFDAGAVTVRNNIVYGLLSTFLDNNEDIGKTVGQQTLTNNCVYNGSTGDNKVVLHGTRYSINAAPGCTNNIETNPQLDTLYRPQAAGVKRGGAYINGTDFYAKQFYYPPNIGAVDDLSSTGRWLLTLP